MIGRFSRWAAIPPNNIRRGIVTGNWGRFLDGSSEASSSRVVVALGSIPCATTFLVFATSDRMIQGGEIVRRWAVFLGMTALII